MMGRKVVVHDMRDTVDIDATRRNIGRNKDTDFTLAEFIERAQTLVLGAIGVNSPRGDAGLLETSGDTICSMFRPRKNENHIHPLILKQMKQEPGLEVLRYLIDRLGHRIRGIGPATDLDGLGFMKKLTG